MKNIRTVPLAFFVAAVPLWSGQAFAQESAAPPDPSSSPQVEIKVRTTGSSTDAEAAGQVVISGDEGAKRLILTRKEGRKNQKVTFLGVNTSSLPEAVAAQLPVEKGNGLLVTFVAKDSPAEKAGLEPNDVLVKLDEHILVNTAQLQTVIENRQEGDSVTLGYYRKGQEKAATATLASQEKSAGHFEMNLGDLGDLSRNANFQMALVKAQEDAKRAIGDAALAVQSARGEIEKQKEEWAQSLSSLKEALKGIDLPSGGLTTTFTKPGSAQALTLDHEGIFLLTRKENAVHLRATDKSGRVIFDGEVTTAREQSKVPPEIAAKLQQLLKDFPADNEPATPPVPPTPSVLPVPPMPPAPAVPTPPSA